MGTALSTHPLATLSCGLYKLLALAESWVSLDRKFQPTQKSLSEPSHSGEEELGLQFRKGQMQEGARKQEIIRATLGEKSMFGYSKRKKLENLHLPMLCF